MKFIVILIIHLLIYSCNPPNDVNNENSTIDKDVKSSNLKDVNSFNSSFFDTIALRNLNELTFTANYVKQYSVFSDTMNTLYDFLQNKNGGAFISFDHISGYFPDTIWCSIAVDPLKNSKIEKFEVKGYLNFCSYDKVYNNYSYSFTTNNYELPRFSLLIQPSSDLFSKTVKLPFRKNSDKINLTHTIYFD